jgi:uncharacterized protein (UPF0332 family)
MTAGELLALARDLCARADAPPDGVPEAVMYRSVINRAYYAAFTGAVAFLGRIGFVVNNSSSAHAAVQHALNNAKSVALSTVSTRLSNLGGNRRLADYVPSNRIVGTRNVAEEAIRVADDILTALEGVPVADLGAIAIAILNWATTAGSTTVVRKSGKA